MVIIKEIYLYVWFITLVMILSHYISAQTYQKLLFVWMVVATVQAILVILQVILQFGSESSDPLDLFQNPNLAASYLLISLFMVALATSSLRCIRIISLVLICGGILATGSRASMLAAVFGCLTILAFPRFKKLCFLDKRSIVVVKMLVIFIMVLSAIIVIAQSSIFRHSIKHDVADRYNTKFTVTYLLYSATDRLGTWAEGLYCLSKGNIFLGVGQDASKEALSISENITGILRPQSMHNDLVSFLVERGVLGLLGFLILCMCIADRILRQYRFESQSGIRSLTVSILMGGCVAIVVTSLFHQVFHFRHFWFFLAIIYSNSFHAQSTAKKMYPTILWD